MAGTGGDVPHFVGEMQSVVLNGRDVFRMATNGHIPAVQVINDTSRRCR